MWLALLAVPALYAAPAGEVIAVGIPPLQWVVSSLLANRAAVVVLLKPGQSPHTFEPTPRQIAELSKARAFFYMGLETERTVARRAAAQNRELRLYDLGHDDHAATSTAVHRHDEDCDPHLWLAPPLMAEIAGKCAAALRELYPADQELIATALATTLEKINALHENITDRLKPLAGATMLVYHPSWGHFADTYGLHQLAIEDDGKPPSARHLAKINAHVKETGAQILFSNPDAPEAVVRRAARMLKCRVVTIDPLAANWDENLLATATLIATETTKQGAP